MHTRILITTILFQTAFSFACAAAEPPTVTEFADEPQSPRARKIMKVLTTLNLNDPQVKRLVSSVDGKVKNGYMTFDEERVAGGTLKLHYQLSGGVRADNLELRFTPDDSNMQYTARTTGAMAAYRLRF